MAELTQGQGTNTPLFTALAAVTALLIPVTVSIPRPPIIALVIYFVGIFAVHCMSGGGDDPTKLNFLKSILFYLLPICGILALQSLSQITTSPTKPMIYGGLTVGMMASCGYLLFKGNLAPRSKIFAGVFLLIGVILGAMIFAAVRAAEKADQAAQKAKRKPKNSCPDRICTAYLNGKPIKVPSDILATATQE